MFILINSTCSGHYYAHHQENRLCKQLHVEMPGCVGSSRAELGHEQSALYENWYTTVLSYPILTMHGHMNLKNIVPD